MVELAETAGTAAKIHAVDPTTAAVLAARAQLGQLAALRDSIQQQLALEEAKAEVEAARAAAAAAAAHSKLAAAKEAAQQADEQARLAAVASRPLRFQLGAAAVPDDTLATVFSHVGEGKALGRCVARLFTPGTVSPAAAL